MEVELPSRISASDRMAVLKWLHSYKGQVKEQNPSWLVMFKATERTYILDIVPLSGQQITRPDQVENAWKQLSFEYA